jgi:NADPH-dependent 2,4-dienoyl-CoA reductase/sulfur reductase-like enzyme
VTVVVADRFPNYSICGLPYWLGREVKDWRDLAHRSIEELESHGLQLQLDTVAIAIDPEARRVSARSDAAGASGHTTGSSSRRAQIRFARP